MGESALNRSPFALRNWSRVCRGKPIPGLQRLPPLFQQIVLFPTYDVLFVVRPQVNGFFEVFFCSFPLVFFPLPKTRDFSFFSF